VLISKANYFGGSEVIFVLILVRLYFIVVIVEIVVVIVVVFVIFIVIVFIVLVEEIGLILINIIIDAAERALGPSLGGGR